MLEELEKVNMICAGNVHIKDGMIMLVDPCWLERWKKEADLMINEPDISPGYIDPPLQHPFSYPACHVNTLGGIFNEIKTEKNGSSDETAFVASVVSGVFPVFLELENVGNIGKRVKRVIIDFSLKKLNNGRGGYADR